MDFKTMDSNNKESKKIYWTYSKSEWFKKDLRSFALFLTTLSIVDADKNYTNCLEGIWNLTGMINQLQKKGVFSLDEVENG